MQAFMGASHSYREDMSYEFEFERPKWAHENFAWGLLNIYFKNPFAQMPYRRQCRESMYYSPSQKKAGGPHCTVAYIGPCRRRLCKYKQAIIR